MADRAGLGHHGDCVGDVERLMDVVVGRPSREPWRLLVDGWPETNPL
jgi:hypothetical protein